MYVLERQETIRTVIKETILTTAVLLFDLVLKFIDRIKHQFGLQLKSDNMETVLCKTDGFLMDKLGNMITSTIAKEVYKLN